MAIIIDTNCFSRVFNSQDAKHADFEPVLKWIVEGNGFIVYGGTKYTEELKQCTRYLKLFNLLKTLGKAIEFKEKCKEIDKTMHKLEIEFGDDDFDDPHLPAIAQITKCKLICSNDTRSIKYVRNPKMYPKKFSTPVYYTGKKDKKLLIDRNIDQRLHKYKKKLSKAFKERVMLLVNPYK